MGTSSSFGGPGGGTPLVPSWVDQPPAGAPAPAQASGVPPNLTPANAAPPPGQRTSAPDPTRFAASRTNLTRFATSGGTDTRSLGRAVSGYVSRAAGGSASAARRLGASRRTAAGLLNFLSDVRARGAPDALRAFNLEALAGRPVEEVFLGLADIICPEGGTVDDGVAREAFIETIVQLAEEGVASLDALSTDQMQTVFELYATNAIEARLCNDVGGKILALPATPKAAAHVQAQLKDFIRRGVADSLTNARAQLMTLTTQNVARFVDAVYASAFEILRAMGEKEAQE